MTPQRGSLRRKISVVVMTTTVAALLISAGSLLLYELRSYRTAWIEDLTTQADLVANSIGAALIFNDAEAANQSLALLRLRPQILAAAVYAIDGRPFATYVSSNAGGSGAPALSPTLGSTFEGDRLHLVHAVVQGGERIGTVVLVAHHDVTGRLRDYLAILGAVTLASLALAALIFSRLQHTVTQPILAVAQTARDVLARRDFGLRVPKSSDDEVGALVDAFNDMLAGLALEIEQRRRAEDALRLADRRKDEFLATLAHELRNPLAPLLNGLELLRDPDTAPEVQQRARNIMARQLKQMVRLIDDLLDVSRITTDKLALRLERRDLREVIGDAIEVVDPVLRESRHTLTTRLPARPVCVDADSTRLAQVFVNLLNNAARYTAPGGRIGVELVVVDDAALVSVADNGIGIDPAAQPVIFEMFVQAQSALERGRAGLGVGLTLARKLVELHGGTIALRSAGIGQGSTFTIRLPLPTLAAGAPTRGEAPMPVDSEALVEAATPAEAAMSVEATMSVEPQTPVQPQTPVEPRLPVEATTDAPTRGPSSGPQTVSDTATPPGKPASGAAAAGAPPQVVRDSSRRERFGDARRPGAPHGDAPPANPPAADGGPPARSRPAVRRAAVSAPPTGAAGSMTTATTEASAAAATAPIGGAAADAKTAGARAVPTPPPARAERAPGPLRVLIADDNVDLASSLGDVLDAIGFDVRTVHDGQAALDMSRTIAFDVALFDIGMPGLNGYELARQLRSGGDAHDLLMIAVTGFGQDADRQRTLAAGFDRHLVKPVAPRDLIALLEKHAAQLGIDAGATAA